MRAPEWIAYDVVLAIHEAQLAEHGGSSGIREQGLLDSALDRPKNVPAYSEQANLYALAAAYAFGIAKNHSFLDGNKRTAWVVCAVFLELNGKPIHVDQAEVVRVMLGVAEGSLTEDQFADWLKRVLDSPLS